MIIFSKIRYVNFLATGAAGNELILNEYNSTLINAKNGSGKSTVLDAICFAMFGKPFRDVNKNQLINSINGKACLVELWFSIGTDEYHIRRGIKPNIFEIFKGGILLDQEAAVRDYQKFLEQQILKTNFKAFTQSVILGAASYTPFMKLKNQERREVIEDFLDIKVFGIMNGVLKGEIYDTKAELSTIDTKFKVASTKVVAQKSLIAKLDEINIQAEAALLAKIQTNVEAIVVHNESISELNAEIAELKENQLGMNELMENIHATSTQIAECRHLITSHTKTLKFFENNSSCPSCQQNIHDVHKKPIVKSIATNCVNAHETIKTLQFELDITNAKYDEMLAIDLDVNETHTKIRELRQVINALDRENQKLNAEILDLSSSDILVEKTKLKELASTAVEIIDAKTKLSDLRAKQDIAYDILKDSGVKTTIIKEYLPIINDLINQYLGVMEFYVDFTLDESFNEKVRSRCRDDFTYASFSEGEKKRLDIAILFAWRQIAKMKNSVNCNILFLDEILESGLDADGLDAVFQIIEEEAKTSNVFVISHADRFKEKFENVISVEKVGDFSVIM